MGIIRDAFDLILPKNCSICGRFPDADGKIPYSVPEGFHICFDCLSQIVPQPSENRFFPCLSEPYEGDPLPGLVLYIPFAYRGIFARAVPRIKFHSQPQIAEFMGILLGSMMQKDGIRGDLIVPVPLSSSRYKERGYNQADLIASKAAEVTNIAYIPDLIRRVKDTMRQTQIADNGMRSMNVNGAFEADDKYSIDGVSVLLVDDVATTGHTLHEASLSLMRAGASKVVCIALCGNRAVLNAEPF